ncbi:MAG: hypothetical protein WD009_00960 [Phycisphaeraceae bacterium]
MAPATADAILIASYLPNLGDGDIQLLLDLAGGSIGRESPKLGQWLAALVQRELERRESENTPTPAEADLARFNASRWTGAELADALHASGAAVAVSEDHPETHELLRKIDFVLRAWCAMRLRALG